MSAKPIPDGFTTVTPYLTVEGAAKLIEFMKTAFDVELTDHVKRPDGTIGHATLKLGTSRVMVAEAFGPWKPMPTALYLYVPDVDAQYRKAIAAGGTSIMEPKDQFYGDRTGGVKDAFGNHWWFGTHLEDVPPEELQRRADEMMKKCG